MAYPAWADGEVAEQFSLRFLDWLPESPSAFGHIHDTEDEKRGHGVGGSDPGFGRAAPPRNPLRASGALGVAPAHAHNKFIRRFFRERTLT